MNFITLVKGMIQKLFGVRDIKSALGTDAALSQKMLDSIGLWHDCYCGRAPWCDDTVRSLRLEQSVVREFANIALNEMTVDITSDALKKIYESAVKNLNTYFQAGLASGAMVIKPLGEDKVQFVPASAFVPIEYDVNGRLVKVVFPEFKQLSDSDFFTRLEYHSLDYDKGLTITNRAFYSSTRGTLGHEVPLGNIAEWADIEPSVSYPLMKRPAFGYYVNPMDNTIDGSHAGMSVFAAALEMIRKTDIQFGRLDWEFESGERVIHVDKAAIKGGALPRLNKRLYKAVDSGTDDFFKEFSPAFRQADIIAGLDEYKREIEFTVGLSYGDISNPQSIDKTATEIRAAKNRKYNTVTAIQNNLRECLSDLVYALAFFNSMATAKYEFVCNFKDSILTDEETERKQDLQDVSIGIMRPEEYRAKWYGETIEEALKNLPQSAEVMTDEMPISESKGSAETAQAEVQGKSLNGAQTQSLIAIMSQLSAGQITEGQAVALISTAIGISKDEARAIINGDLE